MSNTNKKIKYKNTAVVAMPSYRGSSSPRDLTHVSCISCIGRWVLYHERHLGHPKTGSEEVKEVPVGSGCFERV